MPGPRFYYANMQPQIACLTTSFGRHGPVAAIECVRRAGLTAVELPLDLAGEGFCENQAASGRNVGWGTTMPTPLAEIRAALATHAVSVASCLCPSGDWLALSARRALERNIIIASELGASRVVISAGSAAASERQEWLRILAALGDLAERHGISLCLAPAPGICQHYRDMLLLMSELQHPQIRVSFDPVELLALQPEGNLEVALAKLCPFVRHVHLADTTGLYGTRKVNVLGTGGAVDFLRMYQILRDVKFRGPYGVDLRTPPGNPEPDLPACEQHLADSLRFLARLGYLPAAE